MAKIPIILEPGRADGKLVTTNSIFDENKNMFQSELNDIQDTLNSDNSNKPLSANQGKVLKELLDAKVIEAGSVPIDTEPIEGNITHLVNSDGLAKEFNKCNNEIILGSVYDVSAHNNSAVFESLSDLLSSSNLNTLIPTSVRHGGMSIRFIQNADNSYISYRLTKDEWSNDTNDWSIYSDTTLIDNPEFIAVYTDSSDRILWGVRLDGTFYFGAGCPLQVKEYLEGKIEELQLTSMPDILTFLGNIEETTLADLLDGKVSISDFEAVLVTKADSSDVYSKVEADEKFVEKENRKSLIDSDVADNVEFVENPEFIEITTDRDNKILEAINPDGKKILTAGVKIFEGAEVKGIVKIDGLTYSMFESPEWRKVLVDSQDRIIAGVKQDGSVYISNLYGLDERIENVIEYLRRYVDENVANKLDSNLGSENYGKILGIDELGDIVPTTNMHQKDIYQLGGVPVAQGAGNANKTLVIDDAGNVVPGSVTSQVLTGVVQYQATGKLYVSSDVLPGSAFVLGTGWSGNLSDGFIHTSGNTDELIIQYQTEPGKKYIIGLLFGSASESSIFVAIGDSPKVDAYNGTTTANIGIKSEGGYLKIIPSSTYDNTVKVTLKEVVSQEQADAELSVTEQNVNHGNTTDNITGFWNIAVGSPSTFRYNQNGSRNIALGHNSLAHLVSGTRNIGIGTFAMSQLVSGDHNIAIGSDSLWYINKASDNVAIGFGAFWQMPADANFEAQRNIAIGASTMVGAVGSAFDNVAIGHNSGTRVSTTNPQKNVSIGTNSGYYAQFNNVAVGYNAARYTKGSQNIAIGSEAGSVSNVEQNNSIAIGYNVKTTKSNQVVIGNANHTEFVFGNKKLIFNDDNSVTWETI